MVGRSASKRIFLGHHFNRSKWTTFLSLLPQSSQPFIIDTDASDTGIGAILSQVDAEGVEHMDAYASRILTKAEWNYCVTRKELLAVVTFLQHFRQYLLG